MKSQPPKKDRAFFKRTEEEINLGLSAKEALQYRMEKNQAKKMEERFSKKEVPMVIDKKVNHRRRSHRRRSHRRLALDTDEESDEVEYYDSSYEFVN
jgi:hypothetical protein